MVNSNFGCEKCKSWLSIQCKGFGGILFCEKCNPELSDNYQPDRLRRVDAINSEAIVGSANIQEIAESYRNDMTPQ